MKPKLLAAQRMLLGTSTLTSLSDLRPWLVRKMAFRSLARPSLIILAIGTGAVFGLAGSGCMVTDSPEFTAPRLSIPYLMPDNPPTYQILPIRSQGSSPPAYPPQPMTFDVLSEDLNTRGLRAILVLDYPGPVTAKEDPPEPLTKKQIDPGHLTPAVPCIDHCDNSGVRAVDIEFTLRPDTTPGCHSLTLLVSHDFDFFFPVTPTTPNDLATLTWWLDVQDPLNPSPTDLAGCPSAPTTGDAGVGAIP